MSEKLLVSAYLNIGNIWHHDAKVIGTCWGFQLVHNITEQIAMNNPNKSLPMVMLDDANAALAAKDARIAELEQKVIGLEDYVASIPDYRHLCKELRDKLTAQQQAGSVEAEPFTSKEVDAVIEALEPATHSEDGRESAQAAAFLHEHIDGRKRCQIPGMVYEQDAGWGFKVEPLMTVAQHERIVAAKDAEIAEWREQRNDLIEGNNLLHAEIAELRAQPARQVGGGDRSAKAILEVVARYAPGVGLPAPLHQAALDANDWLKSGAALAPAAVVVDLSDDEIVEIMRPELNPADGGYVCDTGSEELVKGIRLVIARLNRRAIPAGLLESLSKSACKLINEVREFNVSGVYFTEIGDNLQYLMALELENEELRALLGKEDES